MEPDSQQKVLLAQYLYAQAATIFIAIDEHLMAPAGLPGCPARPELRTHLDMPKRSPFTAEGLAALLHAVTHIEFNAINLALDAVWRFGGMPRAYYLDWLKVAAEEARHFSLLRAQLQAMGYDYGDFAAHTGLWDMTRKTEGDVLARMALVPRTLEARGLDATPPMQAKLRKVGTPRRPARSQHPGHHPARRNRPCGDWQPLVSVSVRRARTGAASHLCRAGAGLRRAAPQRPAESGGQAPGGF